MIDVHSHLLPGVDDGARTFDQAAAVLRQMARDGVTMLVCTPHLRATAAAQAPYARNAALLAELAGRAPEAPALRLGWEIMLDRPGVDLSAPELRLAGAPAVLVEFPRTGVPPRAADELRRIRESGVVPVVAHPERYWGASAAHVREWRAAGAVVQTDATYLVGGGDRGALARLLLSQGLVDLLASDNHGDHRSLAAARDWLLELGAADAAELLTRENPRRLLEGEAVAPVPPVALRTGVVERLRALLLGRARRGPGRPSTPRDP